MYRSSVRGLNRHTITTVPKYTNKPGVFGTHGGPRVDTLARRIEFNRRLFFHRIGKLTKPFKTPTVTWMWRRLTWNLFRAGVAVLLFIIAAMALQIWLMVTYHALAVGQTTPVLERKVREHRVSKQVLQMVRTREREITDDAETSRVEAALANQK
jgi:hypothetical protein